MTAEQMTKVMNFVEEGGLVKINGPYVDGFAVIEEDAGELVIRSQVWAPKPLLHENFNRLSFYREELL